MNAGQHGAPAVGAEVEKTPLEHRRNWSLFLTLFMALFLTYGVFAPYLGFYWDDWPKIVTTAIYGMEGLRQLCLNQRPFVHLYIEPLMKLLGFDPLGWHVANFLVRLAGVLVAYRLLGLLYGRAIATIGALLLVVFPAFTHHAIAQTHLISANLVSLAFLSSLLFMVMSIESHRLAGRILLTLAAVAALVVTSTMCEYYFTAELMRPLILWLCLKRRALPLRQQVKHTLINWLPYLAAYGPIAIHRLFFFQSSHDLAETTVMATAWSGELVRRLLLTARDAGHDLFVLFVGSWSPDPEILFDGANVAGVIGKLGVALVLGGLAYLTVNRLYRERTPSASVASPAVLFLHAVVFASASMLVVWSVGLTLDTNGPMKNYYAVIPSLGVALGLAALAHQWLGRSRVARVALAGVIGLNGAVHFQTNLYFAKEWEVQRSVWDQVRARCPDIEQGTTLCLSWPEFPRFTVESQHLSWVANLLYADPDSARLNFQALPLTPSHWGWPNESQPEVVLRPGASFKVWARTRSFVSNGKTLVFYYDKISDVVYCLDRDLPILPRSAPFAVRFWAERSDTSVIRMRRCSKDWTTELRIWKPRSGGWGDYFQRIQLLRQQEDWEGVLALAQEARVRNLVPINTVDLLPELDACLHLDQKSQALRLYETVARSGPYETALLRRLLELRKDRSPLAKDLLDCHGPPILR